MPARHPPITSLDRAEAAAQQISRSWEFPVLTASAISAAECS